MKKEGVVNNIIREERTLGQRAADKFASFVGSWGFIGILVIFLSFWIIVNLYVLTGSNFDPYPFILLNLVLACITAIQVPIILMSQNRQEQKDRVRAEYDYRLDKKSEKNIEEILNRLNAIERKLGRKR